MTLALVKLTNDRWKKNISGRASRANKAGRARHPRGTPQTTLCFLWIGRNPAQDQAEVEGQKSTGVVHRSTTAKTFTGKLKTRSRCLIWVLFDYNCGTFDQEFVLMFFELLWFLWITRGDITPAANSVSQHLATSYRSKARGNLQDRYATRPKSLKDCGDSQLFLLLLWKKSDNKSVIFS